MRGVLSTPMAREGNAFIENRKLWAVIEKGSCLQAESFLAWYKVCLFLVGFIFHRCESSPFWPPVSSAVSINFFYIHQSIPSFDPGWLVFVLSRSVMSDSCDPMDYRPSRRLCPWGFSRQEYWSGLPCPSPGDRPSPGSWFVNLVYNSWISGESSSN